jgi:hypothetical protein
MASKAQNTKTSKKLPLACELVFLPITLLAAALHVISSPLGIEPALSMMVGGGLFGLVLIPILMMTLILKLIEISEILPPGATFILVQWVGLPFLIYYVIGILILDEQHLQAKDSNSILPRNALERAAKRFFSSALDYFPITCVPWAEGAALSPSRQYVFGVHPHGIHCLPLAMFTTEGSDFDIQFPNMVGYNLTGLAATIMFKLPLVREFFLTMGYVDASRPIANQVLAENRSVFVCTGGEEESMMTTMAEDIVVLKKRKGFVRLALAHGAALVPVFGVGNNDVYKVSSDYPRMSRVDCCFPLGRLLRKTAKPFSSFQSFVQTYDFMGKQRKWLQKNFGIALPIFHGRFFTPLPFQKPIRVLIGEPIPTPAPKVRGERPDPALVDEYHAKYMAALAALHAKHVTDRKLRIV